MSQTYAPYINSHAPDKQGVINWDYIRELLNEEGDKYENLVFDSVNGTSDGGRRYMPEFTRYFQLIINE